MLPMCALADTKTCNCPVTGGPKGLRRVVSNQLPFSLFPSSHPSLMVKNSYLQVRGLGKEARRGHSDLACGSAGAVLPQWSLS